MPKEILIGVFGVVLLVVAFKVFTTPMRWALKILLNTGFGFVGLLAFNWIGERWGLSLGLNLVNALVIGVLGLPGFALLLILKVLMG